MFEIMAATAALTLTVTQAGFCHPFRTRCGQFSTRLGTLVSCPWCFAHWVAAGLQATVVHTTWADYGIAVFATVLGAAILMGLANFSMQEVNQ